MSSLALVILALVAYSIGALIAGRHRKMAPALLDLIAVGCMWAVALTIPGWVGNKWLAIGPVVLLGLATGSAAVALRRNAYPLEKSEMGTATKSRGLRALWEGWKALGLRLGNYQSRILLAFFYFITVMPFGIVVRLFRNPLLTKVQGAKSSWTPRSRGNHDIESTRRQF